ncbi:hypothetical protein DL95DRAFT_395042 [Leptodontidium sp. 2 PMI_412]|nr:hypothetical protein DL95DRAFT_395042 [Leptodontidium sp. 2 PMI_412]
MQLIKVSVLALLSSYVTAQDIDNNDVPSQCRAVCANVITLTQTCDRQNDDRDRNFINCVCSSANAAAEIPACEACVANFDRNDGADNDVNDLVRSCSFSRTSYVSMTGSPTASVSGSSTTGAGGVLTTLTGTQSTSTPAITGSASSATASLSSVLTGLSASSSERIASASSSLASLTSAAASPTDTSAASANSVKAAGVFGALFLGVLGLA